jgi:hypothetical protein
MEWIKKEIRLPNEEIDGTRVETFSPIYPKDSEMRHRIMNSQFARICSEVTHWRKLDEPCDGDNVDASDSNCTIHGIQSDCKHPIEYRALDVEGYEICKLCNERL